MREARLASALDSLSEGVIVADAEGNVLEANKAALDLHGYAAPEQMRRKLTDFVCDLELHTLDGAKLPVAEWPLSRTLRGEAVSGFEVELRRKDTGHSRIVSYSGKCVRGTDGALALCVLTMRDLTERRRAEEALRQSEIRLKTLTEHAPAAIAVFDRDMRYLAVSRRWLRDHRLDDDADVVGRWHYDVVPDLPDAWKRAHRRGLAGEVLSAEADRFERADGSVQWIRWEIWPWYSDPETIGGIVIAAEDITERMEAVQRMQESEERYRSLFANISEGFALGEPVLDDRGTPVDVRFLEVNDAFHRQTGIPRGIEGRPLREVLPQLEQSWIEHYSGVALTGRAARFENANADTQRIYEVYAFSPMPGRFASLFRDITEQKRVEAALQEKEAYLRQLIATLPGMVWTTTPDGAIEFVSQHWLDYTGTTLETQLGFGSLECVCPRDRTRISEAWSTARREGSDFYVEFRLHRHDGVLRWFGSRGTPIRDGDGRITRWLGVVTDIDELKETQRALADQERHFRQITETLPQLIWTCNAAGVADYFSPQWTAYTGVPEAESVGSSWLETVHPDDRARLLAAWEVAVRSGQPYNIEFRIRRRDGAYRWFHTRALPLRNDLGQIVKWFGSNTDIDDLKRAHEALEDSERRYTALFNNKTSAIAHYRVIVDEAGKPADLVVERINGTYEQILGVRREDVVGRRATKLFPAIRRYDVDPIETLGNTALDGNERTYETYFEACGRWLSVYAYSPLPGQCTVIFTDITAQKEAEAALRKSESRLALAIKAGGTAVWEMDVATRRLLPTNELLFTMLGYRPDELATSAEWLALIHEEDRPGVPDMIEAVIRGEQDVYWREMRMRAKDGAWHWILSQAIAAERNAHGHATRLVGTHTDISERKFAEQRVREAALHDPLTGLPNRALVFEYGSHLVAGALRNHGHGALLFIDLDRFKPINDLYGHETGDRVLQEVALRLLGCTRHEDLVGRLGGDEFVILLPHLDASRHQAAVVAQHVIERISQPYRVGTLDLSLSPSIGISYYPEHAADVSALIHAADLAMYRAKQSGRASFQVYTPELHQRAGEAYSLEARLKAALREDGLTLHYQPVVDIKTGRLIGAEALLRLTDSCRDKVGPDRFIPIAESTGLIGDLGEWVAMEACRQLVAWRKDGLDVAVAINVSPLQFRQRDFADKLSNIIADSGVDPAWLQVEVTESTVMESLDDAVDILNRIKSLGVKVALDDFGTGYSSLSSLSCLPLDKLKVDQSFVQRIENDPASRAVTEAIIALGRSLKLEVIGEGIESENALRYLRAHGCTQAQGYWFSHPLPATEFAEWCRAQRYH